MFMHSFGHHSPHFVRKNAGNITATAARAAAATGMEGEEVLHPLISMFDCFK
jgi:hypothetical protein